MKITLLFRLRKAFKALVSKDHTEAPALWGGILIEALTMFAPQVVAIGNKMLAVIPGEANMTMEGLATTAITYAMIRFYGKVRDPEKVKG